MLKFNWAACREDIVALWNKIWLPLSLAVCLYLVFSTLMQIADQTEAKRVSTFNEYAKVKECKVVVSARHWTIETNKKDIYDTYYCEKTNEIIVFQKSKQ